MTAFSSSCILLFMDNTNAAGAMETLKVNGITYDVLAAHTLADMESRGLSNVVSMWREQGRTREFVVRRPRGRVEFLAVEFQTARGPIVEIRCSM